MTGAMGSEQTRESAPGWRGPAVSVWMFITPQEAAEAIAITSAAANNKLDNEFLFSRGIRVTSPEFMLSAFDKTDKEKKIKIHFKNTPIEIAYNEQTKKWDNFLWIKISDSIVESIVENFDPELVNFLNKANPNNKEIKILGDMVRAKVKNQSK